jgi:hypothetical protein
MPERQFQVLISVNQSMDYLLHSHRHAEAVMRSAPSSCAELQQVLDVISGITDAELRRLFDTTASSRSGTGKKIDKSLSPAINQLLKRKLVAKGWKPESPIFKGAEYGDVTNFRSTRRSQKNPWRLDFAKGSISIEVAFNHGEAIPWNLLKPVIAGELNHVEKRIQTEFGIVICATNDLKKKGNFDSAVGDYEKFLKYLKPLRNFLTIPLLVIGLKAPTTFRVDSKTRKTVNVP